MENLEKYIKTVITSFTDEFERIPKEGFKELSEEGVINNIEADDLANEYEAYCIDHGLPAEDVCKNLETFTFHLRNLYKEQRTKELEKSRFLDLQKKIEKKIGVDMLVTKKLSVDMHKKMTSVDKKIENLKKEVRKSLTLISKLESKVSVLEVENENLKQKFQEQKQSRMQLTTPISTPQTQAVFSKPRAKKRNNNVLSSAPAAEPKKKRQRRKGISKRKSSLGIVESIGFD